MGVGLIVAKTVGILGLMDFKVGRRNLVRNECHINSTIPEPLNDLSRETVMAINGRGHCLMQDIAAELEIE